MINHVKSCGVAVLLVWSLFLISCSKPEASATLTDQAKTIATPEQEYIYPLDLKMLEPLPVDETLFIVRLLEQLQDEFPLVDGSNVEQLKSYRAIIQEHLETFRAKKVDPLLVERYDELLGATEVYNRYLSQINNIQSQDDWKRSQETATFGKDAIGTASSAGMTAYQSGILSGEDAIIGAAVVGGIQFLYNKFQSNREHNQFKSQATAQAADQLLASFNQLVQNSRRTALTLTEKYQWKKGEAGFDATPSEEKAIADAVQTGDYALLVQIKTNQERFRPQDHFLKLQKAINLFGVNQNTKDPKIAYALAVDFLNASRFVPPGQFYNRYRLRSLLFAGMVWNAGLDLQAGTGGFTKGVKGNSEAGLEIWRRIYSLDEKDAEGFVREQIAWVFAYHKEYQPAWDLANQIYQIRKTDPDFQSKYARLLILNGKKEEALPHVQEALRLGFVDVKGLRTCDDFKSLAKAARAKLDDMLAVKWSWSVKWGVFNDDVLVRNDSAFPLSDVQFRPRIESGGKLYNPDLKNDLIQPGETVTWANVFSIPGSKYSSAKPILTCDQE